MSDSVLPWWQTGVVYQIYPRSFQDTDGDGVGDLPGIERRLDYLSDTLGVDALWLSPFYPSPMHDFGYDISDHTDVDPLFGDLAAFDRLLAAAHARDLQVIVDFVPNHTSDEHDWFSESRESRSNARRDWYIWRDPAPDGGPPNNWLSVFGGPAWTLDPPTGQYYLHSFLPSQPDLDWRNPAVVEAMHDVLRFWLERGVDGFRLDAVYFIGKDPLLRDNPPNPDYGATGAMHKAMGAYDSLVHEHDKDHRDIHAMLRGMRAVIDAYSTPDQPRVLIGEAHIYDVDRLAEYYGSELDELHLPFNFGLLRTDGEAAWLRDTIDAYEKALPPGAWPNYVLGNHDEPRLATRFGPALARLLTMLLLTLRGTPTLYYGDELGIEDVYIPPERQQDPWGRQVPGLGRDGCRTPMAWSEAPHGGFTTGTPWLPLHPDAQTRNVAHQLHRDGSMLNMVRRLLHLRRTHPALHRGTYAPVADAPAGVYVYDRAWQGSTFRVALNLSGNERVVPIVDGTSLCCSTHHTSTLGRLRPDEGHLMLLPS